MDSDKLKELNLMLKESLIINLIKKSNSDKKYSLITSYLINLAKFKKKVTIQEAADYLKIDKKNLSEILKKITGFKSWPIIIALLTDNFLTF